MLAPTKDYRAPGSLRELLYVSVPLMISSGSVSLMHALDRIFLTWSSKEALAAALPAGVLHWTILSLAFGTASYVNAFVAQYEGSDQRDRVAESVWQGVYFSIVASLVMLLFIPLAPLVFQLSGHEPRVQQLEIEYFSILFLGSGPLVLAAALSCFYSGRGQTKVIMVVNIVGALANAVVDYVLIFGKFGFPEMGIRGAAMGTIFGSLVSVAMYSVDMIWGASGRSYKLWPPQPFNNRLFRRLLRFGLPSGANLFMDLACFTLFVQVVGRMGVEQLAATNLAFNINALAFVPMLGMGTAVMTLTGQRVGEGRPDLAYRSTWLAFSIAGIYMGLFAALYVGAPGLILWVYSSENPSDFAAIESYVITLLRYVAIYSIFDAMVIVFSSSIRGAGDTRFAVVFSALCGLLLMVVPTYVGYLWFGGGLELAWAACTAFIVVLGIGFVVRFQQGRWRTMKVIEHTAIEHSAVELVS